MSIQGTLQKGEGDPVEAEFLELQQITLGLFLIWDALGDNYREQAFVEGTALFEWAEKYHHSPQAALEALNAAKERFMNTPWSHYIHCRDFKGEGWVNILSFCPNGNADVLAQLEQVWALRPFAEPKP